MKAALRDVERPAGPSPSTRYTSRSSCLMRRDHRSFRSPLSGPGLPVPWNGVRVHSLMTALSRSGSRISVLPVEIVRPGVGGEHQPHGSMRSSPTACPSSSSRTASRRRVALLAEDSRCIVSVMAFYSDSANMTMASAFCRVMTTCVFSATTRSITSFKLARASE